MVVDRRGGNDQPAPGSNLNLLAKPRMKLRATQHPGIAKSFPFSPLCCGPRPGSTLPSVRRSRPREMRRETPPPADHAEHPSNLVDPSSRRSAMGSPPQATDVCLAVSLGILPVLQLVAGGRSKIAFIPSKLLKSMTLGPIDVHIKARHIRSSKKSCSATFISPISFCFPYFPFLLLLRVSFAGRNRPLGSTSRLRDGSLSLSFLLL